ncbi:hypothetical protein SDJN03_09187, partial [Cucurbita argyrosperma subsp. sororia]
MASLNKQMKGFKSFYKFRDGAHHNVPARNPVSMNSVDKTSVYKYNWLNGKSKKASDQNGGGGGGRGKNGGGRGEEVGLPSGNKFGISGCVSSSEGVGIRHA